jgi:hypothetical protein
MNKHDELLKRIETWTDGVIYIESAFSYRKPRYMGTGISTEELKSLADEYEKLREMLTKAEHVGFKRFYIDRPCWGEDKESWYIFDFETDVRVSEKAFGSAIEAYSYLEAKQSGEEGE